MTGVVLALVLLRFIHLNQSLWLDEATTAMVALRYSIPQIVSVFSPPIVTGKQIGTAHV